MLQVFIDATCTLYVICLQNCGFNSCGPKITKPYSCYVCPSFTCIITYLSLKVHENAHTPLVIVADHDVG